MNITKNPRYKMRRQKDILDRGMEMNVEHIALLLYTLNKLYPHDFYRKRNAEYMCRHQDTVQLFNGFDDIEYKEAKIAEYLQDVPYISLKISEGIYKELSKRSQSPLDIAIYKEEDFHGLYVQNITLMLMTLHFDFGFGEKRIGRVIGEWGKARIDDIPAWLEKHADCKRADTDDDMYRAVENIHRMRKERARETRLTPREEIDTRRALEALRAYQEGAETANGST